MMSMMMKPMMWMMGGMYMMSKTMMKGMAPMMMKANKNSQVDCGCWGEPAMHAQTSGQHPAAAQQEAAK